ncbi:hypothetical protein Tsubulata_012506, partial [Turnera subulata]
MLFLLILHGILIISEKIASLVIATNLSRGVLLASDLVADADTDDAALTAPREERGTKGRERRYGM